MVDHFVVRYIWCFGVLTTAGVPNLGDARGLKVVFTWVHLYQWGDATDVKGDADTKRLGTPGLLYINHF